MPTPAQISEQIEFEREAIRHGIERLKKNTKDLQEKEYASATVYGAASIQQLLPLVVERIEQTNHRIYQRQTGKAFAEIKQYLVGIEPMVAAGIALKVTFDKLFSTKEDSHRLVNVCNAIGGALEDECQMRHYEQNAPGLLAVLKKNYWHKSIGTKQKLTVIQTMMNRCEVKEWKTWGPTNRVKLGGWLLDCIIEVSGWFDKFNRRRGTRTVQFVVPTPEFLAIKDKLMEDAELFAPCAWPMLIPPNNWSNETKGGYLLNEVMCGHDMVRRGNNTLKQGETPIEFLNKIQQVAYCLNPFIVDVAEQLYDLQRCVGKFLPIVNYDLPPKPVDIADNRDARKDYRRKAAEVMNLNAQQFKKSCRTRMTMEAVQRFKDIEQFYIPWSFDYRGRAYPIPAFLTPQDTDFGKSLLRFKREAFMTPEAESWLAFQVATTYGLDKATMTDRLEWTHNNHQLITLIVTDPIEIGRAHV